jgi:hypothetical protein
MGERDRMSGELIEVPMDGPVGVDAEAVDNGA